MSQLTALRLRIKHSAETSSTATRVVKKYIVFHSNLEVSSEGLNKRTVAHSDHAKVYSACGPNACFSVRSTAQDWRTSSERGQKERYAAKPMTNVKRSQSEREDTPPPKATQRLLTQPTRTVEFRCTILETTIRRSSCQSDLKQKA